MSIVCINECEVFLMMKPSKLHSSLGGDKGE